MNDYLAKITEFGTIDAESDTLLADCFQVHPVFQMAVDSSDRHFLILGRKGARFNRSADWFCTHWGLVRSLKLQRYQFDQGGNGKSEGMGRGKIQSTFQQIDGSLNCFALVDPSNPVPVATLPVNTAWIVRLEWEVHGPLVALLTGNWNINVYLESLGGGFEGSVGSVVVPVESGLLFSGPQRTYQVDIPVPAGTPPSGAYKLVTAIAHQVREGEVSGIAGFQEGAILQFFSLQV